MNSSKKAYISLLMAVFLMSVIAALAYIGVFDFNNFLTIPTPVKAIAFMVIFLTLFLFVFCLFNLKRRSSRKKKTAATAASAAAAAAAGKSPDVIRHQGGFLATGLLAAASAYQRYDLSPSAEIDETSDVDVIYEENGVPYINSDLAKKNNQGTLNNTFIKLVESVTNAACSETAEQALKGS